MENANLLELAERCETATGPDTGLDWAIADRLPTRPDGMANDQPYTASLDAAMTLVPEGWLYGIGNPEGEHHALVSHNPDARADPIKAATPALALCAAALRARAAA